MFVKQFKHNLAVASKLCQPALLRSSETIILSFESKYLFRSSRIVAVVPFWGEKLIEKVAENILSAIRNPEEAVFKRVVQTS